MAAAISPQLLAVGEMIQNIDKTYNNQNPKPSYAAQLQYKQAAATSSMIELLPVKFDHGEPTVEFTMDEVNEFTREEGLHQAVVMKFSYGKPELQEFRKNFTSQFDVQGRCNIGLLEFRHILVRFDLYNDYVQFLSRSTGYVKAKGDQFFFRNFPWTLGFNPKEETSMAVVWISFPGLPPNFFAKRSLMSIASAVGKALAVDKATQERTRPSAARVKVILDLLDKHPKKVKLQIVDRISGKITVYYQEVVYDNLPKYCTYCKHQGHDEKVCRFMIDQDGTEVMTEGVTVDVELAAMVMDNIQQLQGDARDYLNAKRTVQMLDNVSKDDDLVGNKAGQKGDGERVGTGNRKEVQGVELNTGKEIAVGVATDHVKSNFPAVGVDQNVMHRATDDINAYDMLHLDATVASDVATLKATADRGRTAEKYQGDLRNLLDEKKKAVDVSSTPNIGDNVNEQQVNRTAATEVSNHGAHEYAENSNKSPHVAAAVTTEIIPVARFSKDIFGAGQSNSSPVAMDNVVHIRNQQEKSKAVQNSKLEAQRHMEQAGIHSPVIDQMSAGNTIGLGAEQKGHGKFTHEKEKTAATASAQIAPLKNESEHVVQEKVAKSNASVQSVAAAIAVEIVKPCAAPEGEKPAGSKDKTGQLQHIAALGVTSDVLDTDGRELSPTGASDGNVIFQALEQAKGDGTSHNSNEKDWTLVYSKKGNPNKNKAQQVEQISRTFSNSFAAIGNGNQDGEQIANTITSKDGSFNHQIVPVSSSNKGDISSDKVTNLLDVRQKTKNCSRTELLKGDHVRSSNTPTLQIFSPQLEQIIKQSQIEKMLNADTIFKQPLVTLNTSAHDIPSQSCESIGEHGGEYGQLVLSTGNNNEVIKANVREMASKAKLWADRREDEEEEDWGAGFVEDSTDEGERCSGDEEVASPALPNIDSCSKLNAKAPVFSPTNSQQHNENTSQDFCSMANTVDHITVQQQIIDNSPVDLGEHAQNAAATTGQQQQLLGSSMPTQQQQYGRANSPAGDRTLANLNTGQQLIVVTPPVPPVGRKKWGERVEEEEDNIPTILFSSPQVEKIIEIAQNEMMMMNENLPIETMMRKSTLRTDQCKYNDDKDWGIVFAGEDQNTVAATTTTPGQQMNMEGSPTAVDSEVRTTTTVSIGREEANIRRLPMRAAKKKKVGPTTSTRSNQSKKKP